MMHDLSAYHLHNADTPDSRELRYAQDQCSASETCQGIYHLIGCPNSLEERIHRAIVSQDPRCPATDPYARVTLRCVFDVGHEGRHLDAFGDDFGEKGSGS